MPAWTTITNALVAVGAKPFATTIQALRDNPEAIAEGAAGAPRIALGAWQRLSAGSSVRYNRSLTATSGGIGAVSTGHGLTFMQAGVFRATLLGSGTAPSRTCSVTRLRAGVTSTVLASTATNPSVVDLNCLPGDVFSFTWNANASAAGQTVIGDLTIGTNGEDLIPCVGTYGFVTGNTFT